MQGPNVEARGEAVEDGEASQKKNKGTKRGLQDTETKKREKRGKRSSRWTRRTTSKKRIQG